jgi:hypothetical protein
MLRKSIDEQTSEYFVKCHSHVLFGDTEDELKREKKQPKKADGHVFGGGHEDEAGKPGGEMVKKKVENLSSEGADAYKSLDERICNLHKDVTITGSKYNEKKEPIHQFADGTTMHTKYRNKPSKKTGLYGDATFTNQDPETGNIRVRSDEKEAEYPTHTAGGSANKALPKKSVMTEIDAILEKGRLRQVNKVKEGGAASGVRRPHLSEEQKKKIIEGSAAKVKAYRTEGYMPDKSDSPEVREQDRDPSNKSMISLVDELMEKSLYDVVNHKRFSKMDPDAGINKKKEEAMERGPADKGKYVPGSKRFNNPQDSQDPKIRYKSLDERVCDLTKDMDTQRERQIHDAAMTVRLSREGHPDTNKAAAKMDVNPSDVQRISSRLDRMHTSKSQTLKSVCDTWMKSSAGMTGGHRVEVPGAKPATLVKADDDDENDEE